MKMQPVQGHNENVLSKHMSGHKSIICIHLCKDALTMYYV